jgi:hypothetical protein
MERSGPPDWPFPVGQSDLLRADSVNEEYAYLAAWPATDGPWERIGQRLAFGEEGPEDVLTVRAPSGSTAVVRFAIGSFFGNPERSSGLPSDRVVAAMRASHELAKVEGPLHPGTMPQYPVPSPEHAESVAVPLAILAVDEGRRGLYSPPRIAVVRWSSAEPVGVGDAAGFDPRRWPPPRLGDWPPPAVRGWEQTRLAGTIERFTAVWGRLLDAWFSGETYPQLRQEREEAWRLLRDLVPQGLLGVYAQLSPAFWASLTASEPDHA